MIKMFGTTIQIGDADLGGTPAYTTIATARKISGIKKTNVMDEVTHNASPGGYEDHAPTLKQLGSVTFEIIYSLSEATHNAASGGLMHAFDNQTLLAYKLAAAGGFPALTFEGYVEDYDLKTDDEKQIVKGTVTLKPVSRNAAPSIAYA